MRRQLFSRTISPQARILAVFALIVTTVVTLTHTLTKTRIAQNQLQDLQATLAQVLPAHSFNNQLHDQSIIITDTSNQQPRTIYTARLNGTPTAVVITAKATDGYVGDIKLLIGIHKDGTVASVRVTEHRETPGLGDKIEHRRSNWILQFDGASFTASQNWAVKKDGGNFDQLTGATITPRAVVRAVRDTLLFFVENKQHLFSDRGFPNHGLPGQGLPDSRAL